VRTGCKGACPQVCINVVERPHIPVQGTRLRGKISRGAMREMAQEYLGQRCAIAPRTLKLRHKCVGRRRARTRRLRGRLHTGAARTSPSQSEHGKPREMPQAWRYLRHSQYPIPRGRPRDIIAKALNALHLITASRRTDTFSCPSFSVQSQRVEFSKHLLAAGRKREHRKRPPMAAKAAPEVFPNG